MFQSVIVVVDQTKMDSQIQPGRKCMRKANVLVPEVPKKWMRDENIGKFKVENGIFSSPPTLQHQPNYVRFNSENRPVKRTKKNIETAVSMTMTKSEELESRMFALEVKKEYLKKSLDNINWISRKQLRIRREEVYN
jgi:hypothetical protein